MRAMTCVGICGAVLLASCSGSGDERSGNGDAGGNGTMPSTAEVQRRTSNIVRPQPGQYRTTVEVLEVDVPGMPSNMKQMMKGAMGDNSSSEYCLTKADVDKGFEEMARRSQQGDCESERFDIEGGRFDAAMTCKVDGGQTVHMTMTGTGSETSSDMTMTMAMRVPGMGEGTVRMKSHSERIGGCSG